MTLDLIGYNICMHVVLEWIKWYSECFNLQDAIDGMATYVKNAGKNTRWRGGSTATTENSPPMTQVSPTWMNIQWPWCWTFYSCCSMLCVCVKDLLFGFPVVWIAKIYVYASLVSCLCRDWFCGLSWKITCVWEECWNVHFYTTKFDCPEVTICTWQGIKINY